MHIPVLTKEILSFLKINNGDVIVDCTLGGGGHSELFLEKAKEEKKEIILIGIDLDEKVLKDTEVKLSVWKNAKKFFWKDNFRNIKEIISKSGLKKADKILADLGLSSFQLDNSGRGFSFMKNEPLLMTFASNLNENQITAKDILNNWSKESIADILFGFGDEKASYKIADAIVEYRKNKKIKTTFELKEIVHKILRRKGKIDSATKTFQAIRMAVNEEFQNLKKMLNDGFEILNPKGNMAIISFHSVEDRIVKSFFKQKEKEDLLKIITKKPICPSKEEILSNRRSRSAKLRIIEKI